jgi:hypothetical protein
MQYSKSDKAGNYMHSSTTVTLQELTAMADFIRNFKLKYARKRAAIIKKKKA